MYPHLLQDLEEVLTEQGPESMRPEPDIPSMNCGATQNCVPPTPPPVIPNNNLDIDQDELDRKPLKRSLSHSSSLPVTIPPPGGAGCGKITTKRPCHLDAMNEEPKRLSEDSGGGLYMLAEQADRVARDFIPRSNSMGSKSHFLASRERSYHLMPMPDHPIVKVNFCSMTYICLNLEDHI
jgi:hypothetical protein